MFDHFHGRAAAGQRGAARRLDALSHQGGNAPRGTEITSHENYAAVGRCGPELDADVSSAPVSKPLHLNRLSDTALVT
jgi:hypothetical protein